MTNFLGDFDKNIFVDPVDGELYLSTFLCVLFFFISDGDCSCDFVGSFWLDLYFLMVGLIKY